MKEKPLRITELDYLKSILIILMIIFHLVHIGNQYPLVKQFVYTFHMPGFLLLSGYLLNTRKPMFMFLQAMWWIILPYMAMEMCYIVAASVLPIREHISNLTLQVFLSKLFLEPLGPYWYLRTLVLCSIPTFFAFKIGKNRWLVQLSLMSVLLWFLSEMQLVWWFHALYFGIGVAISAFKLSFKSVFLPHWLWFIIVLLWVVYVPESLSNKSLFSMFIVYYMLSGILFTQRFWNKKWLKILHFIGRNTLILLLFSPIFTILVKPLVPVFAFDGTGILFTSVSVLLAIAGSFFVACVLEKLRLSRYLVGRNQFILR